MRPFASQPHTSIHVKVKPPFTHRLQLQVSLSLSLSPCTSSDYPQKESRSEAKWKTWGGVRGEPHERRRVEKGVIHERETIGT